MATVLVGGVSPEGERLIQTYLDAFMPNAEIVALKPVGIKGKVKNQGSRADTVMIILDEDLYSQCVGVADAVLADTKTHKYVDDTGLKQFLISKFGVLNTESGVGGHEIDNEDFTDDLLSVVDTLPEELNSIVSSNVEEDDLQMSALAYNESNDSDSEDYSQIISDLKDELARKEITIDSLTKQLEDSTSTPDETKEFIARIKELEEEVNTLRAAQTASEGEMYTALSKVSRAEQVIKDFEALKVDLNTERENVSALNFAKSTLENTITELSTKIEDYEVRLEEAKKLSDSYEQIKIELDEKSVSCSELEEKVTSMSESLAEMSNLQEKLQKYEGYKAQFDDVNELLLNCEKDRDKFKLQLDEITSKYENAVNDLKEVRDELQKTSTSLDDKNKELKKVWNDYTTADDKVKELSERINDLENEIKSSTSNSEELNCSISDLNEKLIVASENIESLTQELNDTKKDLSDSKAELELLQISLDTNKVALDSALDDKSKLEEQLASQEQGRLQLAEEIVAKNDEIANIKQDFESQLADKNKEISDLMSEISEKSLELQHLSNKVDEANLETADKTRLEAEMLELRKINARLNSELEIKNKNEESNNSAKFKVEIANLEAEVKRLKENSSANFKEEFDSLRKEKENLELDLIDRDEQLKEYEENIFVRLGNTSQPKGKIVTALKLQKVDFKTKFVVTCCGTGESNFSAYDLMKRTCLNNPDKKILIIDLANDSYIDQCMQPSGTIVSPIKWLQGQDNFKKYCVNSGVKGCSVKVMSCGLSYINTLMLLNVDWDKRLAEINNNVDIAIIYVGNINNFVAKILFNSFSEIMQSHMIIKATPINLRTSILNIVGLLNSSDIIADCVNTSAMSREYYSKLSEKCKAVIIKTNEGMAI